MKVMHRTDNMQGRAQREMNRPSLLPIIERIDDFPYFQDDTEKYRRFMLDYYYFTMDGVSKPLGYVHTSTIRNVSWPDCWEIEHSERTLHLKCNPEAPDVFENRTSLLNHTILQAKKDGKIPELCWEGEPCEVYTANGQFVCNMDNLGGEIFGVIAFGVHLIAWTNRPQGKLYWLQRRSMFKSMHPGKLDTIAGGGIKAGEAVIDAMAREAAEEASIPIDFSLSNMKACGTVSYQLSYSFLNSPASNPHVLYVYELELPETFVPTPNDKEACEFIPMTEDQVMEGLFGEEFKPIVGIQWVAHFYRHGVLTISNEPHLLEICSRTHRKLDMFVV